MVMCVCVCVDNKMVELYEGAAHVYPNNEEILTQLFMAYVRVGAYQKQQQVQYPPTHYQNYHSHSHSLSLFTHSLYSLSLSLTLSLSHSLHSHLLCLHSSLYSGSPFSFTVSIQPVLLPKHKACWSSS